jgi:hypothetical protein
MLVRTLRRHARRGRPGVRRLRRIIAANMHRGEITDTDVELLVIALLLESPELARITGALAPGSRASSPGLVASTA